MAERHRTCCDCGCQPYSTMVHHTHHAFDVLSVLLCVHRRGPPGVCFGRVQAEGEASGPTDRLGLTCRHAPARPYTSHPPATHSGVEGTRALLLVHAEAEGSPSGVGGREPCDDGWVTPPPTPPHPTCGPLDVELWTRGPMFVHHPSTLQLGGGWTASVDGVAWPHQETPNPVSEWP